MCSPLYVKEVKLTSINGFLGLSNMSAGIENEFIDEAGRHSSKYGTKPINLYKKKQSSGNTAFFNVLLTVHLGSILVNNQLETQFFFRIYLFQLSTCFEHFCAHHQENQLY